MPARPLPACCPPALLPARLPVRLPAAMFPVKLVLGSPSETVGTNKLLLLQIIVVMASLHGNRKVTITVSNKEQC